MRRSALVMGLCLALAIACAASGKIIYVDDDANAPGDGKSWVTAYRYLQDALADARAAEKPAEIRVGQGVYKPDQGASQKAGDRLASFALVSGVVLKGGYVGIMTADPNAQDVKLYEAILSGDLAGNDVLSEDPLDFVADPNDGDWARPTVWNLLIESTRRENSVHVLVANRTDQTAILDGFTVTGGNAYHPPYKAAFAFDDHDRGGAMLNKGGSPTVRSCTFMANSAIGGGGAVYCKGPCRLEMTRCHFLDNFNWRGAGGAINNYSASIIMTNCVFERNDSWISFGAAIYTALCHHEIVDCTFSQNGRIKGDSVSAAYVWQGDGFFNYCQFAHNALGGVAVTNHSNMLLQSCKFVSNSGDEGGGINCSAMSKVKLDKCRFIFNDGARGGGLFISSTELSVTNCLFYANQAN